MCGGRGTRLGGGEKPLRRVAGRPLLDRVRAAIDASRVEKTYAVTAPHTPRTADRVDPPVIEASGDGYVADLQYALSTGLVRRPVLTVAADLALLDGAAVDRVIAAAGSHSLTPVVPAGRVTMLGFSVDTTTRHRGITVRPAGLNVVGEGPDRHWITRDRRLAANVNRPGDLAAAEWLLADR